MKKKNVFLTIVVLAILILSLSIFKGRKEEKQKASPSPTPTVALPPVSEEVEVSLTPKDNNRVVILKIKKIPPETESIDYELSYVTGKGLPRGVLGSIKLEGKEDEVSRKILLGTCSRNVCVYDEGVEKINLVLKFNSQSGSSQFKKEYEL